MKTTIFTLAFFLGFALNTQAETIYKGTIDLTKASNHANIPIEINAGTYSLEVTLNAVKSDSVQNITLSRTFYHHDNEYVCEIEGVFKVGVVEAKIKSLKSDWEFISTKDVFIRFGTSENNSVCTVDAKVFEGTNDDIIFLDEISLELPIRDARFTSIKLSINPIVDGFNAKYELAKNDNENTLRALNPGQAFKAALEMAGNKKISYALTLTADGYYHFNTEYATAFKVK